MLSFETLVKQKNRRRISDLVPLAICEGIVMRFIGYKVNYTDYSYVFIIFLEHC